MSLYSRPFTAPLFSEFRPLLRLLNDPGLYSFSDTDSTSEQANSSQRSSARRAFSPNFDVHETEHAYVLEGELPGLSEQDKKNLEIEFTDQNTLLIRGRIERSHQSGTPPSEQKAESKPEPRKAHVEDDSTENSQQVTKTEDKSKQVGQSAQPLRYWVSERSIGSFQRSFTFPGLVDQDNVKARLKDGVLTIEVPKRQQPTGRKITVS